MAQVLGFSRPPQQLVHTRVLPARQEQLSQWPEGLPEKLVAAFRQLGVGQPWVHQSQGILAAQRGNTIIATGTASGKSLVYQAAIGAALWEHDSARALYLAPTKALGADQLCAWQSLKTAGATWIRPADYDGDTDQQARFWAREHANVILTNPDMLHVGILAHHGSWAQFFRHLKYVVVDEAHTYRGVFGSHVGVVLRRLRRVCEFYGNTSVRFIGASATAAAPAQSFSRLIGLQCTAVTEDNSGHGPVTVGFWESELTEHTTDHGAPLRRSLIATGADMLTDLAVHNIRSVAFIRSRRGAEAMAQSAKRQLSEVDPELVGRVAAYRAGLLPAERREVESRLDSGELLAVSTTPALELGIDISGLDGVVVAGWPGTRASFFQQLGRAGRAGQPAVAIYVAGDDPMDTYLVHHPETIFDLAVEDSVIDPQNPHILGQHLLAAAAEIPLRPEDFHYFGEPEMLSEMLSQLTEQGYLRRRPGGWFWTHAEHAAGLVSLRDSGGGQLNIVDMDSGAVLGTIGSDQAHQQVHPGAIYVHQGRTWEVEELAEDAHTVLVKRAEPQFYTQARELTEVEILDTFQEYRAGDFVWCTGPVAITHQVVSFQRRELLTSRSLGEEPLDLEARQLFTTAVWFHVPSETLARAGITMDQLPGALHAAEHAMIGMLPLVASNDRWDIGGVSVALHPDTGHPTVFVYDGHPGGVGFATRGFEQGHRWVSATLDAVRDCSCEAGCPSCVQSPKCGNRNSPLDKQAAIRLLEFVKDRLFEL